MFLLATARPARAALRVVALAAATASAQAGRQEAFVCTSSGSAECSAGTVPVDATRAHVHVHRLFFVSFFPNATQAPLPVGDLLPTCSMNGRLTVENTHYFPRRTKDCTYITDTQIVVLFDIYRSRRENGSRPRRLCERDPRRSSSSRPWRCRSVGGFHCNRRWLRERLGSKVEHNLMYVCMCILVCNVCDCLSPRPTKILPLTPGN